MRIDAEIEDMKRYPINYCDIPPIHETETNKWRLGNEALLSKLPPDLVKEMARRRLAELKKAGYTIPVEESGGLHC
jgi:hypothetical protein